MKLKSKLGLIALNGVIIVMCFLATIGTTYFVIDSIKNQEITNLKTKYDAEISNLNTSISGHAEEINNLTVNLDRYIFIGTWKYVNSSLNNKISFYPSGKSYNYFGEPWWLDDWRIEDGKLIIKHYTGPLVDLCLSQSYNYSISENDAALILTLTEIPTGTTLVLIKQF